MRDEGLRGARIGDVTVARFGAALAVAGPGPAAGSTAAVTAALAAGLATKVARSAADVEAVTELEAMRARALTLADDDVAAYAGFLRARRDPEGREPGAVELIVQVPSDVVELAVRVAEIAAALAERGPDHLAGDAVTSGLLAASAAEAAAMLVGTNLADAGQDADPRAERAEERAGHARALAERTV